MASARVDADVVIVGAGILGLATAQALVRADRQLRVAVVEKEPAPALHQSGRNSGVIHSGIYYRPDSLKARFAVAGARAMAAFCREHGIEHDQCGKVIVATDDLERARLMDLERRAVLNGVVVEPLTVSQLHDAEPHARGVAALRVPSTGVVDFGEVARTIADLVRERGVEILLGRTVEDVVERPDEVVIETDAGAMRARYVVNCAGLHADVVARRLLGPHPDVRIVPFRGEYHALSPERSHLVRHLIYPVPDPAFPFLGVHLTRGIDDEVHVGPNAVLALAREGYRWSRVDPREMARMARFRGFRRMARAHWRTGMVEGLRSVSRRALTRAVRRLVPEVRPRDLTPSAAGVRAQVVDREGRLLDDFVIRESTRSVHVLSAPSPAATAALVIGEALAANVTERL